MAGSGVRRESGTHIDREILVRARVDQQAHDLGVSLVGCDEQRGGAGLRVMGTAQRVRGRGQERGERAGRTFIARSLLAPAPISRRAISVWPIAAAMISGVAPFCARQGEPDA